jgi:hypothetical protein
MYIHTPYLKILTLLHKGNRHVTISILALADKRPFFLPGRAYSLYPLEGNAKHFLRRHQPCLRPKQSLESYEMRMYLAVYFQIIFLSYLLYINTEKNIIKT